jgi:glycine/D-amino acid oxidase-like deaminating enzyme
MNVGIVGGGVFGVAAALALRERRHGVTVFDQGPVPNPRAASTDLSKTIRRFYGTSETYVELVERAAVQWQAWQERLGSAFYFRIGQLHVNHYFAEGTRIHDSVEFLRRRGAPIEVWSAQEARERYPQFVYRDDDACHFDAWAGYLASGEAVADMARLARADGVEFREDTPVLQVDEDGAAARIAFGAETARFDRAVVAAGVWLNRLVPDVGKNVKVTRQQMAFFEPVNLAPFETGTLPVWAVDPEEDGWYGHPLQRQGWVKVSNDLRGEIVDPDAHREATPDFLDQARDFVARRIPDLARGKLVGSRSCFYANTPDHDFVIDWAPGCSRILVAGGGSGHGFKFGGSIGPVIADALEEKDNPLGRLFRLGNRFS